MRNGHWKPSFPIFISFICILAFLLCASPFEKPPRLICNTCQTVASEWSFQRGKKSENENCSFCSAISIEFFVLHKTQRLFGHLKFELNTFEVAFLNCVSVRVDFALQKKKTNRTSLLHSTYRSLHWWTKMVVPFGNLGKWRSKIFAW